MYFIVLENLVPQPTNMFVLELCFCTKRLIFFVLELLFVYKELEISFSSGVYIFVLKLTFLYWDTYCCTGVYFIVLIFLHAQPMNMFVY